MKLARNVLLALSLTSLAACGGGGGDGSSPAVPANDPGAPDGSSPDDTADRPEPDDTPDQSGTVPETALEGTWESGCLEAAPPASARRLVVQVTERLFSFTDVAYGDTDCSEESALREIETRGTFDEPIPEAGRFIEDGLPIDLSIDEVRFVPRQSIATRRYNDTLLCGTDGWATNVSQSVDGCADVSALFGVETTVERTDYNVFLVDEGTALDDRADDMLLLGTVQSVTDPGQRPEAVDASLPFRRRAGSLARPL